MPGSGITQHVTWVLTLNECGRYCPNLEIEKLRHLRATLPKVTELKVSPYQSAPASYPNKLLGPPT